MFYGSNTIFSRCTGKYPIPGYRIQSLCNPESDKPCCNTKDGTCGISEYYCNCTECTDFRDFRSTELLDWVTEDVGCRIRNITTKEACEFFNKHGIKLTFIGKSYTREFNSKLILHLEPVYTMSDSTESDIFSQRIAPFSLDDDDDKCDKKLICT